MFEILKQNPSVTYIDMKNYYYILKIYASHKILKTKRQKHSTIIYTVL